MTIPFMKLIIGTRGSQLSLTQTTIIKNQLLNVNPHVQIAVKIIITKGDKNMNPIPLDTVGKGWFTKELDNELFSGTIDVAVHSLKDLPETLPPGLIIAGIPEREDPRDVLVSKDTMSLEDLRTGAIIGTDSIRRKIQILHKRKDLVVKSLRGNVNSRMTKLEKEDYDGIILAAAGLKRLGLESKITQYFEPIDIIPSPGQGALAIVVKKENKNVLRLVENLNHYPTVIATQAERAFSRAVEGGCKTPTGAYAVCEEEKLTLYGMIGSLDGLHIIKESIRGDCSDSKTLGMRLAKQLLDVSKSW